MTIPAGNEAARAELMHLGKAEVAERYRNTFRLGYRPTVMSLLNSYTQEQLVERLLMAEARGRLDRA